MSKIIPFPKKTEPSELCISCGKNTPMLGYQVCEFCSQNLMDSFDECFTNMLISMAPYATPKDIERLLINHIYDLQKGIYHNFQKN